MKVRWGSARLSAAMVIFTATVMVSGTASAASSRPSTVSPPGLRPTQVNVTNDPTHRYGEPEVVANPRNPNNLVYFVMSEQLTYKCQAEGDPNCVFPPGSPFPVGLFAVPGFISAQVFVSFNRGRTWSKSSFPMSPAGLSPGDPMVVATRDGTFYIAWDADNLAFVNGVGSEPSGGIAVSKSTDGGRTWSQPVLTGTPIDRPWMTVDLSTGTIYEVSSGSLGPTSTGDPHTPVGPVSDRWLVASTNGVHWTTPQRLGGGGVPGFSGANSDTITAAHGVLAATFRSTSPLACGGSTPVTCTIFETTRDAGATWSRHIVPVAGNSTGSVMVAADPTHRRRYTLGVLNPSGTQFMVYVTNNAGATWSGPTLVAEDASKVHFKPWMAYSSDGVLGLTWRTNQPGPGPTFPYNVWAAISGDAGATFSTPVEISTANSPAPDPKQVATDDVSWISVNNGNVFVAWGDWRPGEMSGFFSSVKLEAFKHSRPQ